MFAKIESYLHHVRRRLSRSEWAIRHLGLTPWEGTSEAPGLLLIQIDGFARAQFERALGRRLSWSFGGHQIKVAPHAFAEANAFYSPENVDRVVTFLGAQLDR